MAKQFKKGLVVGKFSPLHHGHELVINRALELCHEVLIISYSNPEFPGCEAKQREQWLAELFPRASRLVVTNERLVQWFPNGSLLIPPNDADALTHRHFTALLCHRVFRSGVDAVFTSEDYGDGFACALTAYFRQHERSVGEVRHVLVDKGRRQIPISGAMLRADLEAHRHWLSPAVYATFVRRICLLGGESSGKSTLAEALAMRFKTIHVPEYGRELWERRNGVLAYEDLLHIGEQQVALEEAVSRRATRFLFCDTSPLTTLFYSYHLFGRADSKLELLAQRRYDSVILCGNDFPFVQDGTRQEAAFRDHQHAWYRLELARRNVPFLLVTGTVEERIARINEFLQNRNHQTG